MKKRLIQLRIEMENKLQKYCASLSYEIRLASILIVSVIFAIVSLYTLVSGFYNIKKTNREQIEIQHINELRLQVKDSIYQLKLEQHERNKRGQ